MVAATDDAGKKLNELGFVFESLYEDYYLEVPSGSQEERDGFKANAFDLLRNAGFCFSVGREWSPSELFKYYRDLKMLSGEYKRLAWTRKDDCTITLA